MTQTGCMDSNQRGHPMKFQRNGVSNHFVKVTGRIIKQETLFPIDTVDNQVLLSFTEQAIPSLYKMDKYKLLFDNDGNMNVSNVLDTLLCNKWSVDITVLDNGEVDFSGVQVKSYYQICELLHIMDSM